MPAQRPRQCAIRALLMMVGLLMTVTARADRFWFTGDKTLIATSDSYDATVGENEFCDWNAESYSPIHVHIRFKPDVTAIVEDETYERIVEEEILPAVMKRCGRVRLQIFNFFSVRFDHEGREYQESEKLVGRQVPVSMVLVRDGQMGHFTYLDRLMEPSWEPGGDSRLTTLDAVRQWWAKRTGASPRRARDPQPAKGPSLRRNAPVEPKSEEPSAEEEEEDDRDDAEVDVAPAAKRPFQASPAFFEARSDAERLGAVQLWLASIEHESRMAHRGARAVEHPSGTMGNIRAYAVPAFVDVFGKSFGALTAKDRKLIVKFLKAASKETWVQYALIAPLAEPASSPQAVEWLALFTNRKPSPRSLAQLGEPSHDVRTDNAKALVYDDDSEVLRLELLTSAYGYNKGRNTTVTTQVSSSLVAVNELGEVLGKFDGSANVVVWFSDPDKAVENRESFMLDVSRSRRVYLFLHELPCRWGVTMRTVEWMENCAEAGGTRKGESIKVLTETFEASLDELDTAGVGVGEGLEHAGWTGVRIK